jgi:hypothetical protein
MQFNHVEPGRLGPESGIHELVLDFSDFFHAQSGRDTSKRVHSGRGHGVWNARKPACMIDLQRGQGSLLFDRFSQTFQSVKIVIGIGPYCAG